MTKGEIIFKTLSKLHQLTEVLPITASDKIVIFSDMHIGDGSSSDDFVHNGLVLPKVLEKYYLEQNYRLILNGDIEELQKFSFKKIKKAWGEIYSLFDAFHAQNALCKLIGNHDIELLTSPDSLYPYPISETLRLSYQDNDIFLFHGHQASMVYSKYNNLIELSLKYLATPLGIKNYSVAQDSRKQYKIEKRAYRFATKKKVMAIIGHTHRPLFQSLSKAESLQYEIENLCRHYPLLLGHEKEKSGELIQKLKKELQNLLKKDDDSSLKSGIYGDGILVPCLFNSGCCIGKSGLTGLEISEGKISLVLWYDLETIKDKKKKLEINKLYESEVIAGTSLVKATLNSEQLEYIFARIKLLS